MIQLANQVEYPQMSGGETDGSRLLPLDTLHTRAVFRNSRQNRLSDEIVPDNESTHSVETIKFKIPSENLIQSIGHGGNSVHMNQANSQANLQTPAEHNPLASRSNNFQDRSLANKNVLCESNALTASRRSQLENKNLNQSLICEIQGSLTPNQSLNTSIVNNGCHRSKDPKQENLIPSEFIDIHCPEVDSEYTNELTLQEKLSKGRKTLPVKLCKSSYNCHLQMIADPKLKAETKFNSEKSTNDCKVISENQGSNRFFDNMFDGFMDIFTSKKMETQKKLCSKDSGNDCRIEVAVTLP